MVNGLQGMLRPPDPDPPLRGLWGLLRQAVDPTTPGFFDRGVPGLVKGLVQNLQRNPIETVADFSPLGDAKAIGYDAPRAFGEGNTIGGMLALASAAPLVPNIAKGIPVSAARAADDLPMDEASRMARATDEAPRGIRAYHGSPHDFDRFSMEHIGTGEGAQAYGHGLYFAESEDVAQSYRNQLSNQIYVDDELVAFSPMPQVAKNVLFKAVDEKADDPVQWGISYLQDLLDKPWVRFSEARQYREAIESLHDHAGRVRYNPGRTYEVNINADPDDFLDWDAPLSEQPESVRRALTSPEMRAATHYGYAFDEFMELPGERRADLAARMSDFIEDLPDDSGANIYHRLADDMVWASSEPPQAKAAEYLASQGVPGIRYYDQMSRGSGEGTRNYVVWDDSLIDILRKYGIAGLFGTGALLRANSGDRER